MSPCLAAHLYFLGISLSLCLASGRHRPIEHMSHACPWHQSSGHSFPSTPCPSSQLRQELRGSFSGESWKRWSEPDMWLMILVVESFWDDCLLGRDRSCFRITSVCPKCESVCLPGLLPSQPGLAAGRRREGVVHPSLWAFFLF